MVNFQCKLTEQVIPSQDENAREQLSQKMPMKTASLSGEDETALTRTSVQPRNSGIPINTNLIRSWMSMCQTNHLSCAESQPRMQEMPTRLINISMADGTEDVFLYETTSDGKFQSYIALSYCWGRALTLRTTPENVDSHRKRIVWNDLPTLFQNVVSLCRVLGVCYVWIDALCIIQGDLADWIKEGSRMASYFGNSVLTIAADAAANALHTLFPKAPVPPYVITGPGAVKVKVSRIPLHFNMESLRLHQTQPLCTPLASRAWAFQERLMPPRVLHFGPDEIVWECASALDCECGTPVDVYHGRQMRYMEPFRAYHHRALNTETIKLDEYWEELLETYLTRDLTFGKDRLSAIMGLAKQFQASRNPIAAPEESLGQYILGLWSADLIRSLLWFTITPSARNAGFPTWTWASVAGTWIYQAPPPKVSFTSTVKVIGQPPEMWDVDYDSTALETKLVLSGLAVPAKLVSINTTHHELHWTLRTGLEVDSDLELVVNLDLESQDDWNNLAVVCLQVGTSELTTGIKRARGLILQEREESQSYERRGVMRASEDWYSIASYKTLHII